MKKYDEKQLLSEILELNEGRNLGCWPVLSFGWKDADLDAGGCTGIKKLIGFDQGQVHLQVGGHKTLSASGDWGLNLTEDQEEDFDRVLQEYIIWSDLEGEWEGDSWCMFFRDIIKVSPLRFFDSGGAWDYPATAQRIYEAAMARCDEFEDLAAQLSEQFDEVYQEAEKVAEGNPDPDDEEVPGE